MRHPCETVAAQSLATLRSADFSHPAQNDTPLVPGLYLSWDAKQGAVSLDTQSVPGQLLQFSAQIAKPPRWFALNIDLGTGRFGPGDILGLVLDLEIRLSDGTLFRIAPRLRSGSSDRHGDTVLTASQMPGLPRPIQTILHQLTQDDPAIGPAAHHTLILPLPPQDFTAGLRDLRLFVTPAEAGLVLDLPSLSSFG